MKNHINFNLSEKTVSLTKIPKNYERNNVICLSNWGFNKIINEN